MSISTDTFPERSGEAIHRAPSLQCKIHYDFLIVLLAFAFYYHFSDWLIYIANRCVGLGVGFISTPRHLSAKINDLSEQNYCAIAHNGACIDLVAAVERSGNVSVEISVLKPNLH